VDQSADENDCQAVPGTAIVTPDDPQDGGINGSHLIPERQSTALIRTVESLQ
jgi:hypothetical protein